MTLVRRRPCRYRAWMQQECRKSCRNSSRPENQCQSLANEAAANLASRTGHSNVAVSSDLQPMHETPVVGAEPTWQDQHLGRSHSTFRPAVLLVPHVAPEGPGPVCTGAGRPTRRAHCMRMLSSVVVWQVCWAHLLFACSHSCCSRITTCLIPPVVPGCRQMLQGVLNICSVS